MSASTTQPRSAPPGAPMGPPVIIGRSEPMRRLLDQADAIARSDVSVVISGESGTGKELVACLLHTLSARQKGPFQAVNCASFPDSLIAALASTSRIWRHLSPWPNPRGSTGHQHGPSFGDLTALNLNASTSPDTSEAS